MAKLAEIAFALDGFGVDIHQGTLAIMGELMFGGRWRYVGRTRSLTEYRADLDGSWPSRVGNAGRQLLQLPWFFKNLLVKVLISCKLGGLLKKITGRDPEWPY